LLTAQNGILSYNVFRLIASRSWIINYREQWLTQQKTGKEIEPDLLREMPVPLVESIVQLGTALDGHVGTVHGGILSLLIDDLLGYAFEALGITYAVTANLSIDFRSPVPAGSKVKLRAVLTSWEGRKLYFNVHLTDPETDRLHCEAVSLFIIPREAHEKLLHNGFMKR
jgi:acyl-coenzyme A thioesterase PaaI-like protein